MAFHLFDDANQGNGFIVTIIAIPVCVLITILRLTIRRREMGWEDACAVLALLSFLTYCGCYLWVLHAMNGKSPFQLGKLPKATVIEIYKAGYVMNIQTPMNQTFAKLSLLILYFRIFEVQTYFRYEVFIVGAVQIAWGVANVLVRLFFCQPIRGAWNPFLKGAKCGDPNLLMAAGGAVNGLIDFVMIAMALQIVHKLQLPRIERMKMGILFAIGGFSGVIEIIKISITYGKVGNSNVNANWNVAQMATTLICCCFPIYKPLFRHIHKLSQRASSYIYGRSRNDGSSAGSSTHKEQLTERTKNSQDNEDDWVRLDERASSV